MELLVNPQTTQAKRELYPMIEQYAKLPLNFPLLDRGCFCVEVFAKTSCLVRPINSESVVD